MGRDEGFAFLREGGRRMVETRLREREYSVKPSAISTAKLLKPLPALHLRPIEQVVYLRPYQVNPVGGLILRRASHLDAFSAYPYRTQLPGGAPGGTTGTPAVRPPRSSRTGGGSSQASCARDG